MDKIGELLVGKGENYILPFFWQHGEDEETLREYMKAIHESNIGAVCIEARPHEDFCGPKWWQDLDIIMDEARKRDMKVWILDDAHFPTGYANGAVETAPPELCKQYLFMFYTDFYSNLPNVTLNVRELMRDAPPTKAIAQNPKRVFDDDKIVSVVASRITSGNDIDDTLLDLTNMVQGDWLYWQSPPEGMWRIYVVFTTRNKGGRTDYINMLDYDSCKLMLDNIYEKHYERYSDDFGKTIAGFFSDEPALGNLPGLHEYDESIGRKRMPLPWNKDMPGCMSEALGKDWARFLPALWYKAGSDAFTAHIRHAYMNAATRLIEKNFSGQLGKWCEEHGVMYIGHVIEDNNQHARLAASMGHFYRSMGGQHMSGIDVIGDQILVGGENHYRFRQLDNGSDGEFYHYALSKLGSSHAHIDPKKQGRAMCEVFGAYGWGAGTRLMKYLTDHIIVRGINYVVPHAFSPKAFPDPDCPPHMYAHGKNPLYRHFGKLMSYMNRLCHIFNGGVHIPDVAVLYHGEAEWVGDYMLVQKPARVLTESQIDFDIIPSDVFADIGEFNSKLDGKLVVNGEEYKALVIPYSQFITAATARFICNNPDFAVVFIEALPEGISDIADPAQSEKLMEAVRGCKTVELCELVGFLEKKSLHSIKLSPGFKNICVYHYKNGANEYYMLSNESGRDVFEGFAELPTIGAPIRFDAMENRLYGIESESLGGSTRVKLRLEPYEAAVICFGEVDGELQEAQNPGETVTELGGTWQVSLCEAENYPAFETLCEMTELSDIGMKQPLFSGFIRYETDFSHSGGAAVLELEDAFEGVEVWLNGEYAGMKICPPYRFELNDIKPGTNSLRIEVANTLDRRVRGILGNSFGIKSRRSTIIEPSGIIGKVSLR